MWVCIGISVWRRSFNRDPVVKDAFCFHWIGMRAKKTFHKNFMLHFKARYRWYFQSSVVNILECHMHTLVEKHLKYKWKNIIIPILNLLWRRAMLITNINKISYNEYVAELSSMIYMYNRYKLKFIRNTIDIEELFQNVIQN